MITPKIRQFLDDLAADRAVVWELVEGDLIRTGRGEGPEAWDCPLSHLARSQPCDIASAGMLLGLSFNEACEISAAADGDYAGVRSHLRQQLLAACRLPETA